MTASLDRSPTATPDVHRRGRTRLLRDAAATFSSQEWFSVIMTAAFLTLMVIGPLIAPYPTERSNVAERLLAPSATHPFGTDENGMDIFSRVLAAPRVDVSVGLVTALLAVAIGIPLGVMAGFYEGSERRRLSLLGQGVLRLLDVVQAFPVFILAMVLVAVRGAAIENIILAIVFVNVPVFLRLSRSEMLSLRERQFTEAARAAGNGDMRIAFRHLLPNALGPLMNQMSVTVGFAILLTAGLSFVGAGVAPPTPELGAMISTGAKYTLLGYWWVGVIPGIALGVVVFSFAVAGETLRRLLEPGAIPIAGPSGRTAPPPGLDVASGAANVMPRPAEDDHTSSRSGMPVVEALLTVDSLSVEAGDGNNRTRLLDGISLTIGVGETVGVVGESGSGKSVLVRALLLLLPDDVRVVGGSIRFGDRDLGTMAPEELRALRGTRIAPLLPGAREQLNPVVTVGEMMAAALRAHARVSQRECKERSIAALAEVGIPDPGRRLSAYPHELSGGMAQRVCIALALIHRPELIVADEPTAGLDVTVTRQVLDLMARIGRERGTAMLIVTRDLGIVAQYCRRTAVMQHGRIVEFRPTDSVFADPAAEYTQRLIRSAQISTRVVTPVPAT